MQYIMNVIRSKQTLFLLIFWCLVMFCPPVTAEENPGVTCEINSYEMVEIQDRTLDVPITIIMDERHQRPMIVYDPWKFKKVPRYILQFEQARQCVIITSGAFKITPPTSDPSSSSESDLNQAQHMEESEIDCKAINMLREQRLIGSRELQDIAKFYAKYRGVEMQSKGDPRRGKRILECFKYFKLGK